MDLEKAYDRVLRGKLWGVLQEYGIDGQLLRAIQSLYRDCRSCVRVSGMSSDSFPVRVGLRQGCVLSPFLFLVYIDRICRRSLGSEGVNVGGIEVKIFLFADDAVLLAQSQQELQNVLDRFEFECAAAGMKLSVSKTQAMVLSRSPVQCALHVRGAPLE